MMTPFQPTRRRFIQLVGGASILTVLGCNRQEQAMVTLYTFGDSILDCGRYNEFGIHPGQLLVRNNDRLFPEFQRQDLTSQGPARLEHLARDGATVESLPSQAQGLRVEGKAIAVQETVSFLESIGKFCVTKSTG
jgi:acyl-CoA thioesterase I